MQQTNLRKSRPHIAPPVNFAYSQIMALLFANPPLESLQSTHQPMALTRGFALKFPRLVSPFAVVLQESPIALDDLHALLEPGESTYVLLHTPPVHPGLTATGPFGVTQMEWPNDVAPPPTPPNSPRIVPMSCTQAHELVALTNLAFPGFFRPETCRMGPYFGIRSPAGQLVAMAGERLNIRRRTGEDFRELSGVCTHPDHTGKGYARLLLSNLIRRHQAAGLRSYLHVSTPNHHAIDIYIRMGFLHLGEFPLYSVTRGLEN